LLNLKFLLDFLRQSNLRASKEYARQVELVEQKAHVETQRANLAEAKIIELQQELERLHRKKN
jgi:hypothetical protein